MRPRSFRGALLILFAHAAGCGDKPFSIHGGAGGPGVDVALDPFRLTVKDGRGQTVLKGGMASVTTDKYEEVSQLLPGWDGYVAHEAPWAELTKASIAGKTQDGATLELSSKTGERMRLEIRVAGARISLAYALEPASLSTNKSSVAFDLSPDEHFFGLGERYASVDHRGLYLYDWAEEGGLGLGENAPRGPMNPSPNGPSMTYFPVPFFLSSKGYAVQMNTAFRTEAHLGDEKPDGYRVAANATKLELLVWVHDDPKDSLADFTAETGRPYVPAPWVFGPRRRVSFGQQVNGVDEWKLLRDRHVPTTVLDDSVHFLPQQSQLGREAELAAFTQAMHGEGYKVVAYNNPYISASLAGGSGDFDEGKAKGYLVKDQDGNPALTVLISGELQNVASVDFTVPAAVAWYQGLLQRTLDLGYDGWMHDFGEYVGRNWFFGDRRKGDEVHGIYPVLSAKAAFDLLNQKRPGDFLFYVRSGYTGTAALVPEVWGGDPEASFDETQGLPAALRGGLNLGLSGVPFWGSDISGFKCITDAVRDKEVYLRWAEMGALSTSMHDENACSNPLGHREKWTLWSDEETTRVYGDMARLHTRLNPYFMVLAKEAKELGLPVMRHPFLYWPSAPNAWAIEDELYLGPALYAAPVVRRGKTARAVHFPPGRFVDLDDFKVYTGDDRLSEQMVPAPLDKLPLFLIEGRILPLLDPSIETLAPAVDPAVVTLDRVADRLDARVALGPGGKASLELFDGVKLSAERLTADAGNPQNLAEVAAADILGCASCWTRTATGTIDRLRVNTAASAESDLSFGPVRLTLQGGTAARRIRWDVMLLP